MSFTECVHVPVFDDRVSADDCVHILMCLFLKGNVDQQRCGGFDFAGTRAVAPDKAAQK